MNMNKTIGFFSWIAVCLLGAAIASKCIETWDSTSFSLGVIAAVVATFVEMTINRYKS